MAERKAVIKNADVSLAAVFDRRDGDGLSYQTRQALDTIPLLAQAAVP